MIDKAITYRMPAEWEPHAATWLSWPHNEETWTRDVLTRVHHVYAHMIAALARSETVHINVNDATMEAEAREWLQNAKAKGDIRFHHFPTNDAWCRDHGALFVYRMHPEKGVPNVGACGRMPLPIHQNNMVATLVALDWEYNAWGGKYPPFGFDNHIPRHMAAVCNVECVKGGMVLEGGSIDVNGAGLLLTTEACLLNPNRNPHLTRTQIEHRLCTMLGVEQVLWLQDGIVGDDTDGHVDDLTRFVAPDTVVTVVENDPADENYDVLQENLERLHTMRTQHGQPLNIVTLPMPPALMYRGTRLPASYANFYIANRVVLMPCYHPETDKQAQRILQGLFPKHQIVAIDCTDIVIGLGAWHCLTQQVPQKRLSEAKKNL